MLAQSPASFALATLRYARAPLAGGLIAGDG
jgi:hypothetical protein